MSLRPTAGIRGLAAILLLHQLVATLRHPLAALAPSVGVLSRQGSSLPCSFRARRITRPSGGPRRSQSLAAEELPDGDTDATPFVGEDASLRVTPLGNGRGSFLLNMGGQRLLFNPNLENCDEMPPEKVHELTDYVILTSDKPDIFHEATIARMNLAKVNLVASGKAGEKLSKMLVRNLAVLAPGPGGRALLTGEEGSTPLAVLVTPGANGALPWLPPECGFVLVNMKSGVALAYEAMGQFLGPGAASQRQGIPEEAYQVDYLITPELREATGVVKGLTAKGAVLRAVIKLPNPEADTPAGDGTNPILAPLLAIDRKLDEALGGIGGSPQEFREFLRSQGPPLADTCLYELIAGCGATVIQ